MVNYVNDIYDVAIISKHKGIKHVLDILILSVHLNKEDYHKYRIATLGNGEWGTSGTVELSLDKRYVASVIDKSRLGRKDIIPVYEIDLNLNTWKECGHLVRATK